MSMKNIADFYPLSPMQQGMLFHSLYAPDSGVYVEQTAYTLRGPLDVEAFVRAWQRVVDRHPVLRTAFMGEGLKEPVQVVYREVTILPEQQDWRGLDSAEQQARLDALLQAQRKQGFDLNRPPLFRLALLRTADDAYTLVWTHHHILLDGWSGPLLFQEVFAFYEAFRRGRDLQLPARRPYRDYIVWLKRQDVAAAEAYWQRTLDGFTAPTPLMVDRLSATADDADQPHNHEKVWLSEATTARLQEFARAHGLTMNTLVQGAWALLLSRYSGEQDVVMGATVAGRPADLPGSAEMIGLFINTLPVRVRLSPDALLIPWLQSLQAQQSELRQYEYSPLVQVQEWSQVPRGTPLFESILVFENYPVESMVGGQHSDLLRIEEVFSFEQTNYPLTVVSGVSRRLLLEIAHDTRRYGQPTVARMLGHLHTLLEGMAADPYRRLADLPMLTDAERQQMLVEWNRTRVDYPADCCASELFEQQGARTPDAVAVVCGEETLTYSALNRRANQLARYLRKRGVGPEVLVGLCVERAPEALVGMLAVLKAGGAYLPLDPDYPPERLAYMLADARVPVLLTQARLVERLPQFDGETLRLDADWPTIAQEAEENLEPLAGPGNLAYVIYTSGSTGRPKGVMITRSGLSNYLDWVRRAYPLEQGVGAPVHSSLAFD
ncbi:MAG: AMP-binding protein, partial [Chloroflexi bacterium]|nr:AMP-binding protein [Chloroflexota bacterium]